MDEVKNILDYKVGHYKYEDIHPTYKKNVQRSFMFIKQKLFPNGDMDTTLSCQLQHYYKWCTYYSISPPTLAAFSPPSINRQRQDLVTYLHIQMT